MPNFSVTLSQKVLFAVTSSHLGVFVRFSITPDNQRDVWTYIYNKLQNDSTYLTFDDCKKEDNAKALFRSIKLSDDSATNDLDTWCKTFLQDKQISSLRSALRKKSSRRNRDTLTIELDRDVYSDLNDLAAANDSTLKDYLAALIQDRYHDVQPPVAERAKRRNKTGVT
jgi:macrodomain Ter protein organizer (MatP/YcbG family)